MTFSEIGTISPIFPGFPDRRVRVFSLTSNSPEFLPIHDKWTGLDPHDWSHWFVTLYSPDRCWIPPPFLQSWRFCWAGFEHARCHSSSSSRQGPHLCPCRAEGRSTLSRPAPLCPLRGCCKHKLFFALEWIIKVLSSQKVLSGSGRAGRLRLMREYTDHRLVARPQPNNTFWTAH